MLHLLYILAFTIIAFLAVSNLIRSLITVSMDSQRRYPANDPRSRRFSYSTAQNKPIHPELLDDDGQILNEPLLVIRSVSVEDARLQLDKLYESSPSVSNNQDIEEDV